jgi:DNA polymerase III delta subunit
VTGSRTVTINDVETVAVSSGEREIWCLTRLLSEGKVTQALTYAQTLLANGEDALSLWKILLWMCGSLVSIVAALRDGKTNPGAIASAVDLKPGTVYSLLPLAKSVKDERLRPLLDWVVTADIELKTGGYRATSEAPQELHALIDALIVECGKLKS